MNEIQQMKLRASNLRKQKRYDEALEVYHDLWSNHRAECNEWDGWGYATCLRKQSQTQTALQLCREVYRMKPNFEYGKTLYAWCIYDLELKKDIEQIKPHEDVFFKAANAILKLVNQSQFSPYVRTVFKVMDYLNRGKAAFPAKAIIEWADQLHPHELSTTPFSFTDKDGTERDIPSDKEKWYALKTKALEKLQRYQECLDLCKEALTELPKFHVDNEIWFKRRIAISRAHLGEKEQAITELQAILNMKKEWFIQHEIARLYFECGQLENAFESAVDSALNTGDPGKKWKLFQLMGLILKSQGKREEAKKHVLLATTLCEENGWKILPELQNLNDGLEIETECPISADKLCAELRKQWKRAKLAKLPQGLGEVKTILPNGKAGFISGTDGVDYYFRVGSFIGSPKLLQKGLRVRFYVTKSFDKKKDRESEEAIHVECVKS